MIDEPITVSIRDLGVAAALVTSGFEVLDMSRDTTGRVHFIFQETSALDDAVNEFYSDTLQVNARRFSDNTKMLKARIYSEK